MYKALVRFADLKDGKRIYEAGDEFPRPGFIVSPERIAELAGSDNRMGYPLIAEMPLKRPESKDEGIPAQTVKPAKKATRATKRGEKRA